MCKFDYVLNKEEDYGYDKYWNNYLSGMKRKKKERIK